MLFQLSASERGKIWIDGEAIKPIVFKRMPEGFFCQEVSIDGDNATLDLFIIIPDNDRPESRQTLLEKLNAFFTPMGLRVVIRWIAQSPEEASKREWAWKKPYFWGALAASAAALYHMGTKGILWSAGCGLIGLGLSYIVLTEDGRSMVSSIAKKIRGTR